MSSKLEIPEGKEVEKKKFSWNNIAIGAVIQVFEVSTLGQPFEVIKTHMAGMNICMSCFIIINSFLVKLIEVKDWYKR